MNVADALTIRPCETELALHRHYPDRENTQPAYIDLDLRHGILEAISDGNIGGSRPEGVHYGRTRRYDIPVLTGSAANRLLDEIKPLAARILNGAEIAWNGESHVGTLNADAENAENAILTLIEDGFAESDQVQEWSADALTNGEEVEDHGITADTTDAELDAIVKELEDGLTASGSGGPAVAHGLAEHLRGLRDAIANGDGDE